MSDTPTSAWVVEPIETRSERAVSLTTSDFATCHEYAVGIEITSKARQALNEMEEGYQVSRARELLDLVDEIVCALAEAGHEVASLPPVRGSRSEDGALTFEWTTIDLRVGFLIEEEESESGWYVATSQRLGETGAHGDLSPENWRHIVARLLELTLLNT